ncbi:hypothetical protein SS50377_22894 [Spironucleus salmonicida]|uniref:Uncharacterized protein n=1 Tax=Spironucleus salmonicida TaxID=348837 RepID=V6M5W9_9EUKA|nr:hypothetical protein SS50377_22894 [Spironucleus salmonicida]|eukprot:EST48744.1 hypothetical protein SS50377_11064 [Spironucleus salmonicida]
MDNLENLKVAVSTILNKKFEDYADLFILDADIKSIGNWILIAETMNMQRNKIYRWYNDTHRRKLFPRLTEEDKSIIQRELVCFLSNNQAPNKQRQLQIQSMLSQQYHRNTFTIFLNNSIKKFQRVQKLNDDEEQSLQYHDGVFSYFLQ